MNGTELSQLIEQRFAALQVLLDLGRRQSDAIRDGRMTDLMRILSQKQAPLAQLTEIADRLRPAVNDDPQTRLWDSETQRDQCRTQQQQCDRLHAELLAIEAECETAMQASRHSVQQQIEQLNASHQAAQSYAPSQTAATSGRRLDLSE